MFSYQEVADNSCINFHRRDLYFVYVNAYKLSSAVATSLHSMLPTHKHLCIRLNISLFVANFSVLLSLPLTKGALIWQ
ncbi:hypothetical protein V1515DRAFT_594024 [Lipomyces mesembrius]